MLHRILNSTFAISCAQAEAIQNSKFSIIPRCLRGRGGCRVVFDFEDGGGFEDFDAVPLAFGDVHAVVADGRIKERCRKLPNN